MWHFILPCSCSHLPRPFRRFFFPFVATLFSPACVHACMCGCKSGFSAVARAPFENVTAMLYEAETEAVATAKSSEMLKKWLFVNLDKRCAAEKFYLIFFTLDYLGYVSVHTFMQIVLKRIGWRVCMCACSWSCRNIFVEYVNSFFVIPQCQKRESSLFASFSFFNTGRQAGRKEKETERSGSANGKRTLLKWK